MRDGVLLIGLYGSGKSAIAAEMAEALDSLGVSYAAIDLDWLGWFNHPRSDWMAVRNHNLEAVVSNYVEVGVDHLVLAGSIPDRRTLDTLRAVVPVPLRVVEVEVPIEMIEARLSTDPGSERPENLAAAKRWLAEGIGSGLADFSIDNSGPLQVVARDLIRRLGW